MSLDIHVWDTDAVIEAMKNERARRRFTAGYVMKTIVVTGATILELAVWAEEDPAIASFYDAMHTEGRVIIPKRRDFYRAGRWIRGLRTSGTTEERRYQRMKLTIDSLTAATAWGEGLQVVTRNRKDYDRLAAAAEGMLPGRTSPPGHLSPDDVEA